MPHLRPRQLASDRRSGERRYFSHFLKTCTFRHVTNNRPKGSISHELTIFVDYIIRVCLAYLARASLPVSVRVGLEQLKLQVTRQRLFCDLTWTAQSSTKDECRREGSAECTRGISRPGGRLATAALVWRGTPPPWLSSPHPAATEGTEDR